MARSKRSKEEEILHLEKKIRKLKEERSETTIIITGEYKSRESSSSQRENQPRIDSETGLLLMCTTAKEIHAGSRQLTDAEAAARDPRKSLNIENPQIITSELRMIPNHTVLHSPDIEHGEIINSVKDNSRSKQRMNLNKVDAHSSKKLRDLFKLDAHSSRNKPKENSSAEEYPRNQPRGKSNVEDASSSVNESRVISSIVETRSSLNEPVEYLNILEENSLRSEPSHLDTSEAHATTDLQPQASLDPNQSNKNKPAANLDTTEARTPRNLSHTNSETLPEHNPDNFENNSLIERKEALLKALGDELSLNGENIHKSLAQTWSNILRKGLTNDVKEKLLKEYSTPENCKFLKAPVLNEEVADVVEFQARYRDKILENKQKQLGLGITAIARAITVLLNQDENYEVNAMHHLNLGSRILLDLHHTLTLSRRHFFKKRLTHSQVLKNLEIYNLERDDTLFGSKVKNMVKKQGISTTLHPIRGRPSSFFYGDPGI